MASGDDPRRRRVNIDLSTRGRSGLKQWGGVIYEDNIPKLTGRRAIETYRDMVENDATCGAIQFVVDQLCRGVKWRVESASGHPNDLDARDFVESCMHDMESTWTDFISEAMSMITYGFSVHEKVYKRRAGQGQTPAYSSKYVDGRIGWRGFPGRSQDTVSKWEIDDNGCLTGFQQIAPPQYIPVSIPMTKALLFRTNAEKGSPQGRSIFRRAYTSWYKKRGIENIEAIGVERDLAGLPMARVPEECLLDGATDAQRAMADDMIKIVTNIRRDEQEGIVMPSAFDENGNQLYDIKLLSTGGTRQFDVDKIIQRYDHRIAITMCADFILLGQGASGSGSWAMHTDKTQLFAKVISSFLDIICQTLNRFAIPQLFEVNDFDISDYPTFAHEGIDTPDLGNIGTFLTALSQAGAAIFPNVELEAQLLGMAGLTTGDGGDQAPATGIVTPGIDENTDVSQVPPTDGDAP